MLYLSLALVAVVALIVRKAVLRMFDTPNYMPDLSHPVIKHAQQVANLTRKVQLIVPNSWGGYDVIPADRVTLESECNFAGTVRPQPFGGALKCFEPLRGSK